MSDISMQRLENGMVLVTERMPGVASVGLDWRFPVGAAGDPEGHVGESALLNDFLARGAGGMSAREHSDALDRLGVQRSSGVSTHHLSIHAALLGEKLKSALSLFGAIPRALGLEEDGLEPARSLCLQAIESLRDDPQHFVMIMVHQQHLPTPFNRHGYGLENDINSVTIEELRQAWASRCKPYQSILGLAGDIDAASVADQLNELLSTWQGQSPTPVIEDKAVRGLVHVTEDTAQVHLAVCYDAPRASQERASLLEQLAVAVLSGGMSGRLFTEVREKRSLCYSVHASYSAGRDFGTVTLYAGTTPERAQETLDVSLEEMRRMQRGVTSPEFDRAIVGMKSRLVMQGESSGARASAIARDVFRLGRPRALREIAEAVDSITLEELNAYLEKRELGPMTVASLGPSELSIQPSERRVPTS